MYLGSLVELGESYELNRHPIHPYTQTLLSAVPVPDPKLSRTRTVSYTHLDVYKRQGSSRCGNNRYCGCGRGRSFQSAETDHPDVYKRQEMDMKHTIFPADSVSMMQ